jgi:hypothetical protein
MKRAFPVDGRRMKIFYRGRAPVQTTAAAVVDGLSSGASLDRRSHVRRIGNVPNDRPTPPKR